MTIEFDGQNNKLGTTTADSVTIKTNDTDAITIDSSQKVGVGVSSPSVAFEVQTNANGRRIMLTHDTGLNEIRSTTSDQTTYANLRYDASEHIFESEDTEIARFTSTGLAIGGTGSANTLDDYEEGTWTPTYEPVTGAFTSITYDTQVGEYVKIGRLVYITGRVRTDAITVGTASGTVRVTGLPFTTDGSNFRGITAIFGSDWGTDTPTFALGVASSTDFALYRHDAPNNPDTITIADMSTSANKNNIYFNLVYQIAG